MKKSICLGILGLVAFYIGISLVWVEGTKIQRTLSTRQALHSARSLAFFSQDKEALEVAEILSKADIGYPAVWGAIREHNLTEPSVLVFTFIPGDQYLIPFWSWLYIVSLHESAASHAMMYGQKFDWVVFHYRRFGNLWQGLLVLHEGKHALYRQKNPDKRGTQALDELEARKLVLRACQSLGGKPYMELVGSIEEVLRGQWSGEQLVFSIPQVYPPELERIWGKPISKDEETVQIVYLYLHAVFNLLEKDAPGKALQGQLEVIGYVL